MTNKHYITKQNRDDAKIVRNLNRVLKSLESLDDQCHEIMDLSHLSRIKAMRDEIEGILSSYVHG